MHKSKTDLGMNEPLARDGSSSSRPSEKDLAKADDGKAFGLTLGSGRGFSLYVVHVFKAFSAAGLAVTSL